MNVCEVIEAKKESEKLILEIIKSLEQKTEMTVGNIDFVYGHKATEKFQKIEIVSIDLSI